MHLSCLFTLFKILYIYRTIIIVLLVREEIEDSNFKNRPKITTLLREYKDLKLGQS
jgi:hypothetical protein